jgi:hypothetical protein
MEEIRSEDVSIDLKRIIVEDKESILQRLPGKLNKEFRADKWFNFFSGELLESTVADRDGSIVKVYSNPIGKAFDLSGGWADPEFKFYVKQRSAEGYYRQYMRLKREGVFKSGRFKGPKRVPFLAKAVFKTDKFILEILREEGKL